MNLRKAKNPSILNRISSRRFRIAAGGGLLFIFAFCLSVFAYRFSKVPSRPNVILITIDTLRADHLSCYGHTRSTSPHIDALAKKGIIFEMAVSQAPWTLPSMATIHTGLYPSEHGADYNNKRLDAGTQMLAEVFKNAFYNTIGVISHTFVDDNFGFKKGFDLFDKKFIRGNTGTSSVELTDAAIGYLRANGTTPFFLWVHYFDPHYDYLKHADFGYFDEYSGRLSDSLDINDLNIRLPTLSDEDLAYIRTVYDSEIFFTDREIGRLIAMVESLGLGEKTIIAVVGDHGEEFLEHGSFGHGKKVYQELVHVPLIIYDPAAGKLNGKRVRVPVETRFLGRTLLESAGLDSDSFSTPDLMRVAAGTQAAGYVFSEGCYAWGKDQRKLMVVKDHWKLIWNFDDDSHEFYDLAADPGETTDIYKRAGREIDDFRRALEVQFRRLKLTGKSGTQVNLTTDEQERLKALGYMQ